MYDGAKDGGYFEGSEWWSILDNFLVNSQFRQSMLLVDFPDIDVELLLMEVAQQYPEPSLPDLIQEGAVQQAISLLPYIPNILIKLGPRGILSVRLCPKEMKNLDKDVKTVRLLGVDVDIVVSHYPGLKHQGIISVTGAG